MEEILKNFKESVGHFDKFRSTNRTDFDFVTIASVAFVAVFH
jgi:hypothetical protein